MSLSERFKEFREEVEESLRSNLIDDMKEFQKEIDKLGNRENLLKKWIKDNYLCALENGCASGNFECLSQIGPCDIGDLIDELKFSKEEIDKMKEEY